MELDPCFLLQALLAAVRAGESILSVYEKDFEVGYKDDKSPLTLADRNSHRVIGETLSAGTRDRVPVLSEEGKAIPYLERRAWPRFWMVDPLDGTKEFVKRNGEFTVNIALIEGNRPVSGIIFAPVSDEFYFAQKGLGAYKTKGAVLSGMLPRLIEPCSDGKSGADPEAGRKLLDALCRSAARLETSRPDGQANTALRIAGSRSHAGQSLTDLVQRLKTRYQSIENLAIGSSLKFCLIAEGKADIYPRFGPTMEWDTAAGDILVQEAGGRVLDKETGTELVYNKENLVNPFFIAVADRRYETVHRE